MHRILPMVTCASIARTLTVLVALAACAQANAAILFLKGKDEPLYVKTVRVDVDTVIVGLPRAGGEFDRRIFQKSDIDQFIRTVSDERLSALSPEKPGEYRDYAEELAAKKVDPDARQEAIRLYLIAAHRDRDKLGRSSLLGMTALARTPEEERRFRAMSFFLDPKHDRSVLREDVSVAGSETAGDDEAQQRDTLLSALRSLRQGNRSVAKRIAQRPTAIAAFKRLGGGLTHEEFMSACSSAEALDGTTLARLINLELKLTGGKRAAGEAIESGPNWSAVIETGATAPVQKLSLDTLTEFDPNKCIYRDGEWVAPE